MLTPSGQGLTNSAINPRQIAATTTGTTVLYTVPPGRKFVGYIYGASAGASYGVIPVGGSLVNQATGGVQVTSASVTPFQTVLVGGTIITGAGAQIFLNGVESDL
jgi:hypothetical protein